MHMLKQSEVAAQGIGYVPLHECENMRVLVICDRYPFPLHNGQNLRIFHYVRQLRARHQFDLLCYGDGDVPPEAAELFDQIVSYPRPVDNDESLRGRLARTFVAKRIIPASEPFRQELQRRLSGGRYDLLWMSGWDTVVNIPLPCPVPFLADIVDEGVLENWREVRIRTGFSPRVQAARRLLQHWLVERHYFRRADSCLVVADRDAEMFRRVCPGTPTVAIPNGVDEQLFQPLGTPEDEATLVFEGSMEFEPNVDAANYLVREILPLVHRQIPGARVVLVGRDPSPEVKNLQGKHVDVTGFVDDVRPYLDRATVFVCPMRKGAGIKNKVLQAWSMGKAVVATPTAAGGLAVRDEENIVIRDTPAALAAAIVELLRDPARRALIGAAARETILSAYTWVRCAEQLEKLMSDMISARKQRDKVSA